MTGGNPIVTQLRRSRAFGSGVRALSLVFLADGFRVALDKIKPVALVGVFNLRTVTERGAL